MYRHDVEAVYLEIMDMCTMKINCNTTTYLIDALASVQCQF